MCGLPSDPKIPFLGIGPIDTLVHVCKDLGNRVFIAAIFAISKIKNAFHWQKNKLCDIRPVQPFF